MRKRQIGFGGDSVNAQLGGQGFSTPATTEESPPTIISASFNTAIEEIELVFSEPIEIVGAANALGITVHYLLFDRIIEGESFVVGGSNNITGSPMAIDVATLLGPSVSYTDGFPTAYIRSVATGLRVPTTLEFTPMNIE